MSTEELLDSDPGEDAYEDEDDEVLHFPAVFDVLNLRMPDGAAITNVSHDILPGFLTQEMSAGEVYDAVESQLSDAGYIFVRSDSTGELVLLCERSGSGTVAPLGDALISVRPPSRISPAR